MMLEPRLHALLAAGEAGEAATVAIQSLGPSVHGYLCAIHGDDDAADVYSAWCEDVWKGLPNFRFEAPLRAWAFRVAWNASARFRRDPWRMRRQRLVTSVASRLAASTTRGGAPKPPDERLGRLRADLGSADHTLLILRLDRDMTWEEIAQVLSRPSQPLSAATLRKRYERLKERLAQKARTQGIVP